MKALKWLAAVAAAMLMAACGGGGSDAGTPPFNGGPGNPGGPGGGATGATLTVDISRTAVSATEPGVVTATLRSAGGAVIPGAVITFASPGSLGSFSANTALTDSDGKATVSVTPASPSANGADLVVATASVGSTAVSGSVGFTVAGGSTGGQPSITLALSSTAITSVAPATLTATVRDGAGAPIQGQVVTFRTASTGIGSFSVASGLTNALGVVTTQVTPASTTANGADLAIATTSVGGVGATSSVGFSVTPTGTPPATTPSISLALSTTSVTTATPATVTATVRDGTGAGVVGQVVRFRTNDGLGALSVTSALTDAMGIASTTLSAVSATQSGADQVIATATVNNTTLQASQGFQLTASAVTIGTVVADATNLGAYGQTGIQVNLSGFVPGTPVTVTATSACVVATRATLTPASATTTTGVAAFTYRDNGCGATAATDTVRFSLVGSASTGSVALGLTSPTVNSINFVSASPERIYLKGSGFTEASTVRFRVVDSAGNGLPGQSVLLEPTTLAGGLTLNGRNGNNTLTSDSNGEVTVLVNSGTVPTPVRIKASLCTRPAALADCTATDVSTPAITTVSSSLSIGVGLPSQLNFSLSQGTHNIEGYNIDGTPNTYNIIASDRLSNPVPAGTAINFVAEGGQIEASKFTSINATTGTSTAVANFVSSSPRPADGRITVVAYAIGEESFLDQDGNNVWSAGEPFQDLGSLYIDRYYNGHYNNVTDQFVALSLPGATTAACSTVGNVLLGLNVTIPSIPSSPSFAGFVAPPSATSCDGTWGRAYVRRAIETVLSTSSARPLWNSRLANADVQSCSNLVVGYQPNEDRLIGSYDDVGGTVLYNASGAHSFLVADANPTRLNPMAARTTISIAATPGVTAQILGGSPVPSTTEASFATFSVGFTAPTTAGTVTLTFTSPSGLATSYNVGVRAGPGGGSYPAGCSTPP